MVEPLCTACEAQHPRLVDRVAREDGVAMKAQLVLARRFALGRLSLGQLQKLDGVQIIEPEALGQPTNGMRVLRTRHPDVHLIQEVDIRLWQRCLLEHESPALAVPAHHVELFRWARRRLSERIVQLHPAFSIQHSAFRILSRLVAAALEFQSREFLNAECQTEWRLLNAVKSPCRHGSR